MVYLEYFFKKLFTLVVALVLVSIVSFLVFEIIPGDSVTALLGTNATKEREEDPDDPYAFDTIDDYNKKVGEAPTKEPEESRSSGEGKTNKD